MLRSGGGRAEPVGSAWPGFDEDESEWSARRERGVRTFEVVPGVGAETVRLAAAPDVGARRVSPADYPLWMTEADLPAGTPMRWNRPHGEEAVFVKAGELRLGDGRIAMAGSVIVMEAAATTSAAATVASTVLVMGTTGGRRPSGGPVGDAAPDGARVHLIGPRGIAEWARPPTKFTRYYTTATCPTCRLMLMYSACEQHYSSAVHSHTADELIHVLKGKIRVGSQWAEPGDTLAIPADVRYRFTTGPDGYGFLNYRADASYYVDVGGARQLEAGGGGQFVFTGDGTDYISASSMRRDHPAPCRTSPTYVCTDGQRADRAARLGRRQRPPARRRE